LLSDIGQRTYDENPLAWRERTHRIPSALQAISSYGPRKKCKGRRQELVRNQNNERGHSDAAHTLGDMQKSLRDFKEEEKGLRQSQLPAPNIVKTAMKNHPHHLILPS
jgi:hypothetical protein